MTTAHNVLYVINREKWEGDHSKLLILCLKVSYNKQYMLKLQSIWTATGVLILNFHVDFCIIDYKMQFLSIQTLNSLKIKIVSCTYESQYYYYYSSE